MKRPELLSPAGNFEKMKAAILYGADAVYLSGRIFGILPGEGKGNADFFCIGDIGRSCQGTGRKDQLIADTFGKAPATADSYAVIVADSAIYRDLLSVSVQ